MDFNQLKTNLEANNFVAYVVADRAAAKAKVAELIPAGSEVMTMTSVTLEQTGIAELINSSGKYNANRPKLMTDLPPKDKKHLGYVVDFVLGSANALTEHGELLIASNTGSQLGAYSYGAGKVIFVIGQQKIVPDFTAGLKRIYDYVLPLESERAKKAYGMPGSNVSKLLVINKEVVPGRIHVIVVQEELGF